MEESSTDTEGENEADEEEEEASERERRKDQKDRPFAIVPTVNIREERLVDLAETPAFRCLHEVCSSVYCC